MIDRLFHRIVIKLHRLRDPQHLVFRQTNAVFRLQQRKRLMHRRAARMELLRNHLFAEDIPRVDRVGDDRLPQLIVRDLRQRGSRNRNDILPFDLRR